MSIALLAVIFASLGLFGGLAIAAIAMYFDEPPRRARTCGTCRFVDVEPGSDVQTKGECIRHPYTRDGAPVDLGWPGCGEGEER